MDNQIIELGLKPTNKKPLETPQDLIRADLRGELIKMRDLHAEQRLGLAKTLCVDLLALLGVSGDNSDVRHHARAIKYIATTIPNYSPVEIIKAFEMAIKGDFNIEIYQQLNSVVIGRVMREYEFWKKEEKDRIKKAEFKEAPEEIKKPKPEELDYRMLEECDRAFHHFKHHGNLKDFMTTHVYQHLYEKKLLPKHDKDFKKSIMARAIPLSKAHAMTEVQAGTLRRSELKKVIEEIESKKSGMIPRVSKQIIIEDLFKGLIENNKSITDLL